jgi:hypothetical protein
MEGMAAFSHVGDRGTMTNLRTNPLHCRLQRHVNDNREHEVMAKPHRQLKKANHGKRPANAKARKAKRHAVKT